VPIANGSFLEYDVLGIEVASAPAFTLETTMTDASSVAENGAVYPFTFKIPVTAYRSIPLPSISGGRIGDCFVRVIDLPLELGKHMHVNPRAPDLNDKGLLKGQVCAGIVDTLVSYPADMEIKNQGIFILANKVHDSKEKGGQEFVEVTLTDPELHGMINGGHTFAAIQQLLKTTSDPKSGDLKNAHVRLHLYQGIPSEKVVNMAEGLNRSKQVDDASLKNLEGEFEKIKIAMRGKVGEDAIAYKMGAVGDMYILDVLSVLELFNILRFPSSKTPQTIYNSPKNALKYFGNDMEPVKDDEDATRKKTAFMHALISNIHPFLELHDLVKQSLPDSADAAKFKFGQMSVDKTSRAGSAKYKGMPLPFIASSMDHRVPKGWLFPILASLRLALQYDEITQTLKWIEDPRAILKAKAKELVSICVTKYREENVPIDKIGKEGSTYILCDSVISSHLKDIKASKDASEIAELKKQLAAVKS